MIRLMARMQRSERKPSTRNQRIGFAFFWLLVVAYAYFIPGGPNWNTESHLFPAFALVDHGTVSIDRYQQRLGDKSYWAGHYYTDKAPGLSFLAVPVYAGLRLAFPKYQGKGYRAYPHRRFAIPRDTVYLRYGITYLLVILPSALFALLLWLFLSQFTSTGWALLLTGAYSLGTVAWVYSRWFFSHQICAVLLFSAFLAIYWKVKARAPSTGVYRMAALAGLAAGYAVISEYPTAVIAAALALYLLAVAARRWRTLLAYCAGLVPPAVLNVAYNLAAFGKPFSTGYMHVHSALYHSNVGGGLLGLANPASYGVQAPSWTSLYEITFGLYRGLFLVSPVLLLFFVGLVFMWKRREVRPELWLCLGIVLAYVLMDASRPVDQNGWAGGWSVASRHLTPMVPFMMVPMVFGLTKRAFRIALLLLGTISVAFEFMIVATDRLFALGDHNPLVNEMLRYFFQARLGLNWATILGLGGYLSLLPPLLIAAGLVVRLVWVYHRVPTVHEAQRTGNHALPSVQTG